MSDDIDIEEHYVYPDLSIVKTEVADSDYEDHQQEPSKSHTFVPLDPRKIMESELIEVHNADSTTNVPEEDVASDTSDILAPYIVSADKVPPGGEDNQQEYARCFQVQLILDNWGPLIEQSNRFCFDCFTLFPSIFLYENHTLSSHSHLVPATSPQQEDAPQEDPPPKPAPSVGGHACRICNTYIAHKFNLPRHYRHVHKLDMKSVNFDELESLSAGAEESCFVCKKALPTKSALISHFYEEHYMTMSSTGNNSNDMDLDHEELDQDTSLVPSTSNSHNVPRENDEVDTCHCAVCGKPFVNDSSLRSHMNSVHGGKRHLPAVATKAYGSDHSTIQGLQTVCKCMICSNLYKSYRCCYDHIRRCHKVPNTSSKILQIRAGPNPVVIKPRKLHSYQCKICLKIYQQYNACRQHVITFHDESSHAKLIAKIPRCSLLIKHEAVVKKPIVTQKVIASSERSFDNVSHNSQATDHLITPRGVIFKCRVCKIFFLDYNIAVKHELHEKDVFSNCEKCNMTFSKQVLTKHHIQHDHSERFKIIPADVNLGKRLISKCPSCEIHFDESNINKHVKDCEDVTVDTFFCNICSVQLDFQMEPKHKDAHKVFNKPSDFIFVEYDVIERKDKQNTLSEATVDTEDEEGEAVATESALMEKYKSLRVCWNVLYHCLLCDFVVDNYTLTIDHCLDHYATENGNPEVAISKCNICNLNFAEKCFERHYQFHISNNKMNRNSFKILSYEYKFCLKATWANYLFKKNCISPDNVKQLIGNSIYSTTRNIKFEVTSEGRPELTLYICDQCKTVIQESTLQYHIYNYLDGSCKNLEHKRMIKTCEICKISFMGNKQWAKHQNIHARGNINAKSFRIVTFNRPQDARLNKILRDAIKVDGVTSKTYFLYKCNRCNLVMEENMSKIHQTLKDCREVDQAYLECSICLLHFHPKELSSHLEKHNDVDFTPANIKIIQINALPTENENATKPSVPTSNIETTDSKYIVYQCSNCNQCLSRSGKTKYHKCYSKDCRRVCQYCKVIFGKNAHEVHMRRHRELPNFNIKHIKFIKFDTSCKRSDKKTKNDINSPKYVLYQCSECLQNVNSIKSAIKHRDKPQGCNTSLTTLCKLCGFLFFTRKMDIHLSMHRTHPDYNKKNIIIVKFNKNTTRKEMALNATTGNTQEDASPVGKWYIRFQCERCNVLLVNRVSAKRHVSTCNPDTIYKTCEVCQYQIPICTIRKHMKKHIMNPGFTRDFIKVIKFSTSVPVLGRLREVAIAENNELQSSTISYNPDDKKLAEKNKASGKLQPNAYKFISSLCRRTTKKYYLYQCIHCKSCLHQRRNVYRHANKICSSRKKYICKICNLQFFSNINLKSVHEQLHKRSDYTLDNIEIIIFDGFQYSAGQSKKFTGKRKLEDDDSPYYFQSKIRKVEGSLISSTNTEDDDIDRIHTNVLYKCLACEVHFINSHAIRKHSEIVHTENIVKSKSNCEICGLIFARTNLKQHVKVHHEIGGYSLDDFEIINGNGNEGGFNKMIKKENGKATKMELTNYNEELHLTANSSRFGEPDTSSVLFKCNICEIHFMSAKTFKIHTSIPHTYPIIVSKKNCEVCDLAFSVISYKKHVDIHHRSRGLQRDNFVIHDELPCSEDVKPKLDSDRFDMKQAIDIKMRCDVCDVYFLTLDSFERHHRQPHTKCIIKDVRSCDICDKKFSKISYTRHMQIYHKAIVKKEVLDESEEMETSFDDDNSNAVTSDPAVSDDRGKEFLSRIIRDRGNFEVVNVESLPDKDIYRCNICDVHFVSFYSVEKHSRSPHKDIVTKLRCDICEISFTKHSFKQHIMFHKTLNIKQEKLDAPEVRDIITDTDTSFDGDNSTTSSQTFNDSASISSDGKTKLYKCHICDVYFVSRINFMKHMGLLFHNHIKLKETCGFCGLTFPKFSLQEHVWLHHEVRKLQLADFEIVQHTNDKAKSTDVGQNFLYKCLICNVHFIRPTSLVRHISKPHDNCYFKNVVSCEECGYTFSKQSLARHKSLHHKKYKLRREDIRVISDVDASALGNDLNTTDTDSIGNNSTMDAECNEHDADFDSVEKILYRCNVCDVHFITKDSFTKHHEKPHVESTVEEVETCEICLLKFPLKLYKTHMELHHDKNTFTKHTFKIVTHEHSKETKESIENNRISAIDKNLINESVPEGENPKQDSVEDTRTGKDKVFETGQNQTKGKRESKEPYEHYKEIKESVDNNRISVTDKNLINESVTESDKPKQDVEDTRTDKDKLFGTGHNQTEGESKKLIADESESIDNTDNVAIIIHENPAVNKESNEINVTDDSIVGDTLAIITDEKPPVNKESNKINIIDDDKLVAESKNPKENNIEITQTENQVTERAENIELETENVTINEKTNEVCETLTEKTDVEYKNEQDGLNSVEITNNVSTDAAREENITNGVLENKT